MACFIVPATEAIVTSVVEKVVKKQEADRSEEVKIPESEGRIPFSVKLGWLNKMLWGGSALLAFEHVWHGEVVPYFPFLTAAATAEGARTMLHEMATTGTTMAVLVSLFWGALVAASNMIESRSKAEKQETVHK